MRGRAGRMSLRSRILAASLVLVALGLGIADAAGLAVLHGYLLRRVDQQLLATSGGLARRVDAGGDLATLPRVHRSPPLPSAFVVEEQDPAGAVVFTLQAPLRGNVSPPQLPSLGLAAANARAGHPFTVASQDGASHWRVVVRPLSSGAGTLIVATSLDGVATTVAGLRLIDLVVSLGVLAALAIVGVAAVRTSLRPLVEIEMTAEAIAGGDLARRVPERGGRSEIGRLSAALNGMLAQIESAFRAQSRSEQRMRRFVADASHELRTPLTSIRGFAELYRQTGGRDRADVDRWMGRIEEEATRMGGLVEDLLLLARLDAQRPVAREPVDLVVVAGDAVHDAAAAAPDRRITLEPVTGPVVVPGDEARLRQVLANLLSNALAHTPAGSPVRVAVSRATGPGGVDEALVEIADEGPGLTAEAAARVFERFYRADDARSRDHGGSGHGGSGHGGSGHGGSGHGGSGLGLSIVAAIVAAHAGRVDVATAPGQGARFQVALPLA
ncbi:MAG: sensor histidine kinase [Mycobacteriales bacterium]